MKTVGYVIKNTYINGPHKGESFYLVEGGYVSLTGDKLFPLNLYKTHRGAQIAATRWKKDHPNEDFKVLPVDENLRAVEV